MIRAVILALYLAACAVQPRVPMQVAQIPDVDCPAPVLFPRPPAKPRTIQRIARWADAVDRIAQENQRRVRDCREQIDYLEHWMATHDFTTHNR